MHLVSSLVISSAVVGLFLWGKMQRRTLIPMGVFLLAIITPLAWLSYVARQTHADLVRLLALGLSSFGHLWYPATVSQTFAGAEIPTWIRSVRIFWLAFIFVPAVTSLALKILHWRRMARDEEKITVAFLSVLTFSFVLTLLSPGGHQYYRFLTFGGLFAVPFTLQTLARKACQGRVWARVTAVGMIVLFFPTWLAHSPNTTEAVWLPEEYVASEFLASAYAQQDRLTIFAGSDTAYLLLGRLPDSIYARIPREDLISNSHDLAESVQAFVQTFFLSARTGGVVFVHSPRLGFRFWRNLGLDILTGAHADINRKLTETNSVYDNGFTSIYN
jgi:hypothetical protein